MKNRNHRALRALAFATAGMSLAPAAMAGVTGTGPGGTGREFLVSTTGATALSAFTSTLREDTTPPTPNFGTLLLGGTSLTIGGTTYSPETTGQLLGRFDNTSAGEAGQHNQPGLNRDRVVYSYHNTGSVAGIFDLAFTNGVLPGTSPVTISSSNPLFVNGVRANSLPPSRGAGFFQPVGSTQPLSAVPIVGGNYQTTLGIKAYPQIAWSDVRTVQAFSQTGTAAFNRAPLAAGYGLAETADTSGRKPIFQQLAPVGNLIGGLDPATTHLRNDSLAVIPFTLSASPGSGLATLKEADFKMLQVRGRLPNGANFNYVTRDIGSGTRNQGGNNLEIDPSWAGGERDRRYLGSTTFNVQADNGQIATVEPGDEQAPLIRQTNSSGSVNINEHRPSLLSVFSDKTSGGNGVRPQILSNRMALGIVSSGDTGARGRLGTNDPMRVLGIQWEFQPGEAGANTDYTQPTAFNVSTGRSQFWSAAQAVTVAGTLATGPSRTGGSFLPVANDGTSNPNKTILNDVDDDGSGVGVVRKVLNNITGSAAAGFPDNNLFTPLDGIILGGFMPVGIMQIDKAFDGAKQTAGNPVFNQTLFDQTIGNPNSLTNTLLNWAPASGFNGSNVNTQRYRVFDISNTSSISAPIGTFEVNFNARTFLVGDLNGDGVRDLSDANAFGRALAGPAAFLDADTTGIDSGQAVLNNSSGNNTLNVADVTTVTGLGRRTATLIPLTDLNADGNVIAVDAAGADVAKPAKTRYVVNSLGQVEKVATPANFGTAFLNALGTTNNFTASAGVASLADRVVAVSREDAEYFIYGASIDTTDSNLDLDEFTPGIQNAASYGAAEAARRRSEIGVRTGQLKVNAAATAFNAGVEAVLGASAAADDLKFEIRDVDQSGSKAFANATVKEYGFLSDALLMDAVGGKNYANLADSLSTPLDLPRFAIAANPDTIIGQDDMDVLNQALTTTAGVNPIGRVDHTWGAVNTKPGNLVIRVNANSGTFTVPAGGTLQINAGSFSAGGTVDPFTQGANRLSIINNSAGSGVEGGLAITAGAKSVATVIGSGRTTVAAGATLNVNPGGTGPVVAVSQGSLEVSGTLKIAENTGSVVIVDSLSVTGGFVDLTNNDLIVRSTALGYATEIAAVRSLVRTWYTADGGLPGTTGLGSSLSFYTAAGDFTTLGVYDNSALPSGGTSTLTSFAGQTVSATDILVKYTYLGDTDLSGTVDASDLARVLQGLSGAGTGWNFGDVNYDGVIDFTDLGRVQAALRGQGAPLGSAGGFGGGGAIPEPAGLGLLAAMVPFMSRRRR
jgi:hypothetical protein